MRRTVSSLEDYLKPTPTIDSDNELVREKAQALTKGVSDAAVKASNLFYWVRDEIKYNALVPLEIFENYRASDTLKRREGYCVEKAAVLAALARAAGIPAGLHFADIRNYLVSPRVLKVMGTNLFSYHGYTELYINEKWVKATPAFDLKVCSEHRIIPVEFDGRHDALFHSHDLDGKLHIEYIEDHGVRIDVPVDEILGAWMRRYGVAAQERLARLLAKEEGDGVRDAAPGGHQRGKES
jgi:transglutaminase-like putative cysteine protease